MSLKNFVAILFALLLFPLAASAEFPEADTSKAPLVIMETSMGTIKIELFDQEAPLTVENFRNYVKQGFYNGLIFHRVIPKFMIQGGGFEPGMKRRNPSQAPVPNEATNGLKNKRGTLSMARTGKVHSATSQFFVNVVDNISLDNRGTLPHQFGYAVFGKVVQGMDVADRIVATPATTVSSGAGQFKNVPKQDVMIIKMYEEEKSE
ncbi:MAG: peptidylprolyl isomerase [Thermodesulfobacteriota bacterium]